MGLNTITTRTVNIDGQEVEMGWICFCHLEHEWEHDWEGPSIDDKLIEADVYGEKLTGGTFEDVLKALKKKFNWEY